VKKQMEWSKGIYEKSVSSGCWWYTLYDEGWIDGVGIAVDKDLMGIVDMEKAASPVPEWARQIVTTWINYAPPCGHYLFPLPFLEILSAVGAESADRFRISCYAVQPERKQEMMDYCLCLDAWLAGVEPQVPARELDAVGYRRRHWQTICRDLWRALGERNETRELQVEEYLASLRHAIKASHWTDDGAGSQFGRDQYLGEYVAYESGGKGYERGTDPRAARRRARLAELCPNWESFSHVDRGHWWLCGPKAFRFLERDLWAIGQGRPLQPGDHVPGFLQCEDTYPNQDEAPAWWQSFLPALDGWWQGQPDKSPVAEDVGQRLGEPTPVKRWLVRLFLKKLKTLEANGEELTSLVGPRHGHKRGTRPLSSDA